MASPWLCFIVSLLVVGLAIMETIAVAYYDESIRALDSETARVLVLAQQRALDCTASPVVCTEASTLVDAAPAPAPVVLSTLSSSASAANVLASLNALVCSQQALLCTSLAVNGFDANDQPLPAASLARVAIRTKARSLILQATPNASRDPMLRLLRRWAADPSPTTPACREAARNQQAAAADEQVLADCARWLNFDTEAPPDWDVVTRDAIAATSYLNRRRSRDAWQTVAPTAIVARRAAAAGQLASRLVALHLRPVQPQLAISSGGPRIVPALPGVYATMLGARLTAALQTAAPPAAATALLRLQTAMSRYANYSLEASTRAADDLLDHPLRTRDLISQCDDCARQRLLVFAQPDVRLGELYTTLWAELAMARTEAAIITDSQSPLAVSLDARQAAYASAAARLEGWVVASNWSSVYAESLVGPLVPHLVDSEEPFDVVRPAGRIVTTGQGASASASVLAHYTTLWLATQRQTLSLTGSRVDGLFGEDTRVVSDALAVHLQRQLLARPSLDMGSAERAAWWRHLMHTHWRPAIAGVGMLLNSTHWTVERASAFVGSTNQTLTPDVVDDFLHQAAVAMEVSRLQRLIASACPNLGAPVAANRIVGLVMRYSGIVRSLRTDLHDLVAAACTE